MNTFLTILEDTLRLATFQPRAAPPRHRAAERVERGQIIGLLRERGRDTSRVG